MKPNIQLWKLEKILPYPNNVKKHPPEQVAKIAKSIKEFGWTQPIVVDRKGEIIAGHGRKLAATLLGLAEAPVWVRDDLTDDDVKALRLADNRVAQGDYDTNMLQAELAGLEFDLDGIFDKKELDFFAADLGTLNDDAFVSDLDAEVKKQAEATVAKIKEVDERDVSITDALGFKRIKGADERRVVMWMAELEAQFKLTGADAFVAFIKCME